MRDDYVFHVHSWRCGHAERVPDVAYVERALELGAKRITFTDHAPFPGDPFTSRMSYSQLDEYLRTLKRLRDEYAGKMDIRIGLEIEYLPSFDWYYERLLASGDLDLLLLGQHHYEVSPNYYSFQIGDGEEKKRLEAHGLMKAQIEGVRTGFFKVVAHPDRAFRNDDAWTGEMTELSNELIAAAIEKSTLLEINLASIRKREYREEFWNLVPKECGKIVGCDAHFVEDVAIGNWHECQ